MEKCQACGTSLMINERLRLIEPLRPLERHNYTEIFEVDDRGTRKVMKVLKSRDTKLISLMQREASMLQLLEFPGIPRVDIDDYFSFTPNGSTSELHCLILEKFSGHNLEQWLKGHGRISQSLALDWLEQLVHILDHVHQAGFFHRDIKPTNIIRQPGGQLALIDFGGVREVSETYLAKVSGAQNTTGMSEVVDVTVIMTAGYAPPEQFNGKALPQSDFFALGRTFVHLMTGIYPTNLTEDSKTGKLIWRDKAPQIDKPIADFIDELMALTPGRRPKNTQVILQYLKWRLPRLLKLSRVVNSVQFKAGITGLILLTIFACYKGASLWAANYYFSRGTQNQLENKPEAAKKDYEQAIKFNPNDAIAHNNLALACVSLRDFPCAYTQYQQALKLKLNYWQAHYGLGNLYDEQGNYAGAEKQYRIAMQSESNLAVDAINNLSRLKNRTKEYKAAIDLALQGLQRTNDPISQAALYKNLGWAQLKQHRYNEAKAHLQKALELDPERTDAYCLLAQVQEVKKDIASAGISWEACLRLNSNLPEVREWRDEALQRFLSR